MRFVDTPESSAIKSALAYVLKRGIVSKDGVLRQGTQPVGLKVLGAVDFLRSRSHSVRLTEPTEIPGFPNADPTRWAAQRASAVLKQ